MGSVIYEICNSLYTYLIMKIIRLTTLLDFGGQERQYISFAETDFQLLKTLIFEFHQMLNFKKPQI